jgi:hypothetical protein
MILSWSPWKLILLGFVMNLVAMILPALMVLQVIKSTFFLNFLAFLLSIAGMLIGFIGMTFIVKLRRD